MVAVAKKGFGFRTITIPVCRSPISGNLVFVMGNASKTVFIKLRYLLVCVVVLQFVNNHDTWFEKQATKHGLVLFCVAIF